MTYFWSPLPSLLVPFRIRALPFLPEDDTLIPINHVTGSGQLAEGPPSRVWAGGVALAVRKKGTGVRCYEDHEGHGLRRRLENQKQDVYSPGDCNPSPPTPVLPLAQHRTALQSWGLESIIS